MIPGTVVVGFYELPIHIAVAHEVLGSDCPTRIGDIPAQILAPRPLPHRIDYPAVPPALPGIPGDQLGSPFAWLSPLQANTQNRARHACGVSELSCTNQRNRSPLCHETSACSLATAVPFGPTWAASVGPTGDQLALSFGPTHAFLAALSWQALTAGQGRTSSLRCGRSTLTCGSSPAIGQ
jgi:hypothetical protein